MSKQMVALYALLAIFALAKANNDVENVFKAHEIIPDVIRDAPKEFLKVSYDNHLEVDKGNELTPTQVKLQPKVIWPGKDDEYYSLIMSDPDAPSRTEPKYREFCHWLVVNIPCNNIDQGDVIKAYVGPGPPKLTGLHRYVFLLYKQPGKQEFNESRIGNNSRRGRPNFNSTQFAEKYNLGTPIAGNFYQAQYDVYVQILHKQLSEGN